MNILFVVPYVPNQIRVRSYHLISELVRHKHRVLLATLWTTDEDRLGLKTLAEEGVEVISEHMPTWRSLINSLQALGSTLPLQAAYSWRPKFAQALAQSLTAHNIDLIHVEHLRGTQYGLHLQRAVVQQQLSIPVVWDSVDCISYLFQQAAEQSRTLKNRLIARLETPRTRHYERQLIHQFDQVLVSSPVDKAALEQLATGQSGIANIAVVPNGVDLNHFAKATQPRAPASLIYTGKMSYHANTTAVVHLVKEIMPQVWAQRPEVTLWIVGKDPSPEVMALGTPPKEHRQVSAVGSKADSKGRVVITGTVKAIYPYLQKATLAVAPILYGAGIQNKVLEAMACGAPVIASPQATSALAVCAGRDLWVAESADEFAQAILHLLDLPALRQQLSEAGRSYVEHHHSWSIAGAKLEAIYQTTRETWQMDLHKMKAESV